MSDDLRPFGWSRFPEEISEDRIVVNTGPSSEVVLIKSSALVFVIISTILYYFTQHIMGLIVIIAFLSFVILPVGAAERIVVTPTGISFTKHVFLFN
jgi:hypothetical protein